MATEKKNANNISYITILSSKDISYQPKYIESNELVKIPKRILTNEEEIKNETNTDKLTLISSIKNALINKDNDTLLWCLQQKDINVIEATVKKMDINIIKLLIEKALDIFQSNKLIKKNIHIWLKFIIQYHKFIILSSNDKDLLYNIKVLQSYIANYTKYLNLFENLGNKLNKIFEATKDNINTCNDIDVPLVNYVESDNEDDVAKNQNIINKMKEKGFEEVNSNEPSSDNSLNDVDEFNDIEDDDIDYEDSEDEDNRKNKSNEENENDDDEEDEENEED